MDYSYRDFFKLLHILTAKKSKKIKLSSTSIKTKVLSLDHRIDRKEIIEKRLGKSTSDIFFKSFSPDEIRIESLPESFITKKSIKYLTNTSICCILSHVNCWINLLEEEVDSYLILEDDFIPLKSNDLIFQKSIRLPQEFDLVILGNKFLQKVHIKTIPNNGYFVPWICRRGFYSYIISKKGVLNLLNLITPINITSGGIDTIVSREIRKEKIEVFRSVENLFDANRILPSDIINPDIPDKIIFKEKSKYANNGNRIKNTTDFINRISSLNKHLVNNNRVH